MNEEKPKVEYWDCSDQSEILHYTEFNDAIEYHLDAVPNIEWPETLTVYGFAREIAKPNIKWISERALEAVIEGLDEDYGNPEEQSDWTNEMKNDATEFVQKVIANYQVWSCKQVTSEEINVMDWVKEHRPDWLEEFKTMTHQPPELK